MADAAREGELEGFADEKAVGASDGKELGMLLGPDDNETDGLCDPILEGNVEGNCEGIPEGNFDESNVGT